MMINFYGTYVNQDLISRVYRDGKDVCLVYKERHIHGASIAAVGYQDYRTISKTFDTFDEAKRKLIEIVEKLGINVEFKDEPKKKELSATEMLGIKFYDANLDPVSRIAIPILVGIFFISLIVGVFADHEMSRILGIAWAILSGFLSCMGISMAINKRSAMDALEIDEF